MNTVDRFYECPVDLRTSMRNKMFASLSDQTSIIDRISKQKALIWSKSLISKKKFIMSIFISFR